MRVRIPRPVLILSGGMMRKGPVDISGMDRRFFEALSPEARVELLCRLHALAIEQAGSSSGIRPTLRARRRPMAPSLPRPGNHSRR